MFRKFMICIALMAAIVLAVAASADEVAGAAKHREATAAASSARAGAKKAHREAIAAASSSARADAKTRAPGRKARASREADPKKGRPQDPPATGDVKMSGMSILGNEDAPKSLVIVPWKSAQIGKMPGLSMLLDDSVRPVDKDVFLRELAYYQLKSGGN